jgi:hypothetical protein
LRPFSAACAVATAGHHGFELDAGVGLVFEPFLGRRGALALAFETPRHARPWALLGLALGESLRRSARHHFRWAREQARREPERWSPLLRAQ